MRSRKKTMRPRKSDDDEVEVKEVGGRRNLDSPARPPSCGRAAIAPGSSRSGDSPHGVATVNRPRISSAPAARRWASSASSPIRSLPQHQDHRISLTEMSARCSPACASTSSPAVLSAIPSPSTPWRSREGFADDGSPARRKSFGCERGQSLESSQPPASRGVFD